MCGDLDIREVAKDVNTAMKIMLSLNGGIVHGYAETHSLFYQSFPDAPITYSVPDLMQEERDPNIYREQCLSFLDYLVKHIP